MAQGLLCSERSRSPPAGVLTVHAIKPKFGSASLRAGKRAAAVMSLVHSAKINGHDPYAYLKDIL